MKTTAQKAKAAAYAREYYAKNKAKILAQQKKPKGREAIKFTSEGKEAGRATILKCAIETGDMFDLFGASGENYYKTKKEAPKVKITSIDSCKDFKNEKILRKLFKKLKDCRISTIQEYATNATEKDQKGTIWFDYCGPMSGAALDDISIAHKIMKHKGYFFVTFLRAREAFMAKGTARKAIDGVVQALVKETLADTGIKAKPFYSLEYMSAPEYEGRKTHRGTPMCIYGFKFVKDEALIKRMEKKAAKAKIASIKSMYTTKQIKEMVNTLNTIGYTITK